MAAPQASQRVADIQRRAAEKPEVAFKAFDTYPWQADQVLVRRLTAALYNIEPTNTSEMTDIALQMRINRFAERVNIHIDKQAYEQWLAETRSQQPRLFSDQHLAQEVEAKVGSASTRTHSHSSSGPFAVFQKSHESLSREQVSPEQRRLALLHAELGYPPYQPAPELIDPSVPSWQREAPKADLFVAKDAGPSNSEAGALPYPKKFEEILKFLETGQMIPGVRQIPDTVIDDPSISTRGTMQAPLKPWERNGGTSSTTAEQGLGMP